MNNLADIGRSEKRKYPGVYDQWTDEEVGQAVIDRDLNEGRTDMAAVAWNGAIADIALVDTGLRELLFADPALAGKIQQSFDYYDPRLGVFSNWLRRLRGEGRNKLLEVLNQEQKLLIEQAAILERQVREGKREQVEYHLFVARNISELMALKANAEVNRQAFGSGMNPDHYSQVNYEKALSEMRTKEHRDKSEIDLATKIQESEHILVKTREQDLYEQNLIKLLKSDLQNAIVELEELKTQDLPKSAKQRLVEIQEKHIDNLEKQLDERYSRLVQDKT